jgi:hypothetical protein
MSHCNGLVLTEPIALSHSSASLFTKATNGPRNSVELPAGPGIVVRMEHLRDDPPLAALTAAGEVQAALEEGAERRRDREGRLRPPRSQTVSPGERSGRTG